MEKIISERKQSEFFFIGLGADYLVFMGLIVVFNVHLMGIGSLDALIMIPGALKAGEWWRLLTHPFAHVSWYHLVLDASAFFMLYRQIHLKITERIIHVGLCGIFSLGGVWLLSPDFRLLGLCGLSGIAHGLMAVVSLEMIRFGRDRLLGWLCLAGVCLKSIIETVSGAALFSFVYADMCGTPLVACHLGGVVGGIVSFGLYFYNHRRSSILKNREDRSLIRGYFS